MNPSAAQHTLFEVKERPFHSGERMNADEGSPMRNAAVSSLLILRLA